jgi:hypothetical protein
VDLAVRTKLDVDSIDAWLMQRPFPRPGAAEHDLAGSDSVWPTRWAE